MNRARLALLASFVVLLLGASLAGAETPSRTGFENGASFGFTPAVPVSALARGAGWFDPSRLSMSTTVSVGTGFGGQAAGLQVTSFRYRFGSPLDLQLSLGNAFGAGNGNGSFFLEGLSLRYRPSANTIFNFEFHDVRSPLQYGLYARDPFAVGAWGR